MNDKDDTLTPDDLMFEDAETIMPSNEIDTSDLDTANEKDTMMSSDEPTMEPEDKPKKALFGRPLFKKKETEVKPEVSAPVQTSKPEIDLGNDPIEFNNDRVQSDDSNENRVRKPHNSHRGRSMGRNNGRMRDRNSDYEGQNAGQDDMPLEERISEDLKNSFPGKGVLEITPSGFGFLRPRFTPSPDDIYVSQSQIRKFWLRPGDEVEGLIRPPKDNEKYHGLLKIEKVNGVKMTEEESRQRTRFNYMTSLYPDQIIKLETDQETLSTRIIDLVSPIGFGQRGLIVSPPKAGKTTLLKDIANGIRKNYPDAHLIAILIGERPEEVTDVTRSIDAEVVSSHFDQSPKDQIRAAEIGLERAKRLVEQGKDVIILLDSITRLARAYNMVVNSSGRTLSGGFDPAALYPAKKFLGAARNVEDGGSLTIIGTALVNTESRMDDLIYEEFKGTGNMEVHLDRESANKRIFPAIDVEKSGTRHDELLLDKDQMEAITMLHRMIMLMDKDERLMMLIDKLKKTKTNDEFLKEITSGKK